MNLNNFEHYMERVIFERGLDYYEHQSILSLVARENVFEAEVAGTELYNVKVELDELKNIVP
jgi:uncharacterized Zn finger protein